MKRNIIILMAMMLAMQLNATVDGTYKSIVSEYTLGTDGSITQRVSKVLKYNTHHSFFKLFGETFVIYNPEYQKVKVDTSYTIQKDGTIIKTPANAFNYVLPSMAAKAPDYNKLTELVITHTGLELGATAYLEYTITTEAGAYNCLDIDETIGVQGADIDKYQVIVNIPEGTALRWSLTDSKVKPTIKGGKYTWTFTGIKSAKGEANTPYSYEGVPHLAATTARTLADNLMPLTIETRDLRRTPSEYLKNAKSDRERVDAIQKYIVSGLANCGVKPYHTANRVRQCGRVMETAYGTEAEKALAMAKLMRAEGLQAKAAVVYPTAQDVKTLRNVAEYCVYWEGLLLSVKKTGESPLMWRGDRYTVCDLAGENLELPYKKTEITLSAKSEISKQKVTTEAEYSVNPQRNVTKKENINNKFSEEKKGLEENNGYITYTLPSPAPRSVDTWGMRKLGKERNAAFEIPYTVNEKCEYELTLNGVTSVTKSVQKSLKNSVGSVNISIENKDGKIVVKRSIELNTSIIPANKYKEFLTIMRLWNNDNMRKVILKK